MSGRSLAILIVALVAVAIGGTAIYHRWPTGAKAVIEGPTYARAREFVEFRSASTGHVLHWRVEPACVYKPIGERTTVIPLVEGQYTISLTVVHLGWFTGLTQDTATQTLVVSNAPPPPGPGPGPLPPGPGPSPGPDRFGFTEFARSEASRVSSSNRVTEARGIAGVFRAVADRVRSGNLTSPVEVASVTLDELDKLNMGVITKLAWRNFAQALYDRAGQVFGMDAAVSDIEIAWREIAAGLEAVQ